MRHEIVQDTIILRHEIVQDTIMLRHEIVQDTIILRHEIVWDTIILRHEIVWDTIILIIIIESTKDDLKDKVQISVKSGFKCKYLVKFEVLSFVLNPIVYRIEPIKCNNHVFLHNLLKTFRNKNCVEYLCTNAQINFV